MVAGLKRRPIQARRAILDSPPQALYKSRMFDALINHVRLATMDPAVREPFGFLDDAAIGVDHGHIAWVGKSHDAPPARRTIEGRGRLATPALLDCHTHLVFAGNRAFEFEMRRRGALYAEIAAAGGGILSTVKATRAATRNEIIAATLPRLRALIASGVATVEIKSGYGLSIDDEMKLLDAARELGRIAGVRVRTTLLGAHALPVEYAHDRAAYVQLVCEQMIPQAAARGLADAVDVFCETIGFTPQETKSIFEAAGKAGLRVKIHAEQLSNQHGAALAAQYGALSADHLEYLDDAGAEAMAAASVVAILLPGAYFTLNESRKPPVDLLRRHGVKIALATDQNPGTSPMLNAAMAMPMASTLFGLTAEECLAGMTREGARALGLEDETGMIRPGLAADIALWPLKDPGELAYWLGAAPEALFINGEMRFG
jgi:imidazolonepropionase